MNEHTKRAIRVTARAEERAAIALREYKAARRRWRYLRGYVIRPFWEFHEATEARARWSALADLLASESDVPEQAVA